MLNCDALSNWLHCPSKPGEEGRLSRKRQIGSKVSNQSVIPYQQQAGDEDRKHRKLELLATSLFGRMSEALLCSSFLRVYAREYI